MPTIGCTGLQKEKKKKLSNQRLQKLQKPKAAGRPRASLPREARPGSSVPGPPAATKPSWPLSLPALVVSSDTLF